MNLAQKIKSKVSFTLNLKQNNARYIVSVKNLYTGKLPTAKALTKINFADFDSVGGWTDDKTNIYYLDANLHFKDKYKAKTIGLALDQIAIFDSKEKRVINLKYKNS